MNRHLIRVPRLVNFLNLGGSAMLWDVTTESDKEIIVNNSKGMHSKYYEPGPFSRMEDTERSYVEWILSELQRP